MFVCRVCECGGYQCDDCRRDLEDDLASAKRRRDSLWRSKLDGRMTNEPEVDQAIRRLDARIAEMERELKEQP